MQFLSKIGPKYCPGYLSTNAKKLIDKLHDDLKKIKYRGSIALCGYGEPLLHKDISYIVKKLAKVSNVEIVTNGDVLTPKVLKELYESKAGRVLISMYDGPSK